MNRKSWNQFKLLLLCGFVILISQKVRTGSPIITCIPGMVLISVISLISLKIKDLMPNVPIPAFAWASLIATIMSMPMVPGSKMFLDITGQVEFASVGTSILAYAGISVGNKLLQLKKLSWKILIVSIFVFCGTYFGSAMISQFILKAKGLI